MRYTVWPFPAGFSRGHVKACLWPFPPFPNPLDTGHKKPKFNPSNHEDAPL